MLWNLIRDFIVQHITGGVDSEGLEYYAFSGNIRTILDGNLDENVFGFNDIFHKVGSYSDGGSYEYYLSSSDWLATTLTIISVIFILVACVMFVVKIIKLVGNLVK